MKAKPAAKAKAQAKVKAKAKSPKKLAAKPALKLLKQPKPQFRFQPLSDRVVVLVEGSSDRTPGGLYIPESANERPSQGEVLSVGPGLRNKKGKMRPMDVKVGDRVIFGEFAGMKTELGDDRVVLLREEEILGILN